MTDDKPFGLERTPENKQLIEVLQGAKEIATANPRVGVEMLRILAEEEKRDAEQSAQQKQSPPAQQTQTSAQPPRASRRPRAPHARRLNGLELHQTHCSICGHDNQEPLEQAFLNWEHVGVIAADFGVDRRTIYRHAHATSLFAERDLNVRCALRHIIQKADGGVDTTADSVIRAVKTFAHMNTRGEWVNPPTRVIFTQATKGKSNARPQYRRKRSVTPRNPFQRLKP